MLSKEIHDYPGFITQPMSWEMAFEKFERLTGPFTTAFFAALDCGCREEPGFDSSERPHAASPQRRRATSQARSEDVAPREGAVMASRTQHVIDERAFDFLRTNDRGFKPRTQGITEIRGPYYSPLGKRHLEDILETMGNYVDALKFAGGSFSLMPRQALEELISLCHEHNVLVSTGGFIEHVLTQGPDAVNRYIKECKELGFDIIEVSSGFITLPADDWLRLVEKVQKAGLKAKPEVGIQFGAGGATKSGRAGSRRDARS